MSRAVKALLFDVFGTVVDWRSSVAAEVAQAARTVGVATDGFALADAWRGAYAPSMDRVRKGEIAWANIDTLHRAALDALLPAHGLAALDEPSRDALNRAWHRLHPWPDSVAGLARLKRHFIIGTLSNGNVGLLVNMAKFAGLPWDVVISGELFRHYKPDAETYDGACSLLGLAPSQVMLVAAHNGDLAAARARGMRTGFVLRATEYGPAQARDLRAEAAWDIVAGDFNALADQLGA
jgi:2-haloacid dehalogenase